MIVTTKDKLEIEIKDEALDDYELLEWLDDIDGGQTGKIARVFRRLVGEEQRKTIMEHYRDKSGVVPATKMVEVISEIMELISANNKVKN